MAWCAEEACGSVGPLCCSACGAVLLWVGYLYLTFWGFRSDQGAAYNQYTLAFLKFLAGWLLPAAPDWMVAHIPARLAADASDSGPLC